MDDYSPKKKQHQQGDNPLDVVLLLDRVHQHTSHADIAIKMDSVTVLQPGARTAMLLITPVLADIQHDQQSGRVRGDHISQHQLQPAAEVVLYVFSRGVESEHPELVVRERRTHVELYDIPRSERRGWGGVSFSL